MNGFEMLEALNKHPEGMGCAVMLVTVRTRKDDVAQAKACGAEDYIAKPFELSELVEKIENILERRAVAVN
jgi:DNA-binding response OmpR family regulator